MEARSYKEGSRVQVVQESRDEVSMKKRFDKLRETSIFGFTTQAALFVNYDRSLPIGNRSL